MAEYEGYEAAICQRSKQKFASATFSWSQKWPYDIVLLWETVLVLGSA